MMYTFMTDFADVEISVITLFEKKSFLNKIKYETNKVWF